MSPSWRSRLRITLSPGQARAVLVAGRPRQVEKTAVWHCPPSEEDSHPWQGALRALADAMPSFGVRGAPATVVLSNHFVRYALLPWSDQVTGAQERQALARILFEKHFGSQAAGWSIRLSDGAYGEASLASAVDPQLPDAILATCAAAGLKSPSIQPALMTVFNDHRRQLTAPNACLVVAEPGKLGLLAAHHGQCLAVRTMPFHGELAAELGPLVRRELLLAGLPLPARVYVHAPDQTSWPAVLASGLDLEPLQGVPA